MIGGVVAERNDGGNLISGRRTPAPTRTDGPSGSAARSQTLKRAPVKTHREFKARLQRRLSAGPPPERNCERFRLTSDLLSPRLCERAGVQFPTWFGPAGAARAGSPFPPVQDQVEAGGGGAKSPEERRRPVGATRASSTRRHRGRKKGSLKERSHICFQSALLLARLLARRSHVDPDS